MLLVVVLLLLLLLLLLKQLLLRLDLAVKLRLRLRLLGRGKGLEHEVTHFQSRLHRIEDGHRLELARLKKEVEYHKRLRQGADQRSYELEDRLGRMSLQQQQHASAAARDPGHDEEKDGLIAQSQLLVSKNSELSTRVKMLESQVSQLEELKAALESELNQAYCERDELATELERILTKQHGHLGYHSEVAADGEGYGEEGEEDIGGSGGASGGGSGGGALPEDGQAPA
ncbi:hypothetical protein GPECTOR_5g86 [Gonium pectorale]|uniref:Uncharacterized protein n=1 Tax=Gonium pectorale TaxID=33097 RepID=A0A150GXF7_GONPE|nr:hypothetical protein GPECTOR_5g86 [Gonium pectorale]|eukprot:KXZ54433.1 hypothetical protein GPECTOR_5g86 [Gonium pectorale]